jgi:ABC-type sugar transport system ATPase subunit
MAGNMSSIRLDHITRCFGTVTALNDISLEIRDHEVVTIVGPSGCGKSTLLRIIAGLEQPTSGSVWIDAECVTGVPTRFRNLAMVFQSYALYPQMTCYENLALNLRLKKLPSAEIDRRVHQTAGTLQLTDLLGKKPRELSGGERQRVAVGRALIRNPRAYLFDEPLSNLDAILRERVRHELKELFQRIHATVIYVTHDQIEALTLADRMVVLDAGVIQQIGTPEELYHSPVNRFVGSFIGSPSMNFFETRLDQGRIQLGSETIDTGLDFSGRADIGIRPEAIRLDGRIPAAVAWIENLGFNTLIGLRVGSVTLTALASQRPTENSIGISVDPADVYVFDKDSGSNISYARGRGTIPS